MNYKSFLRLLLLWLSIACLGFINGAIRDAAYLSLVGDLRAHQIATAILSLLVLGDVYLFLHKSVRKLGDRVLFQMGLVLFVITAIFEFGFGHYILKAPWSSLLFNYNILEGRVWGVFLLIQLLSPLIVKKITGKNQ